jgi:hypothetical protein
MLDFEQIRKLALALPDISEAPHFDKSSFRYKRKILFTFDHQQNRACFKLPLELQAVYTKASPGAIYPVPNKWGMQGWTLVEIRKVSKTLFREMMKRSFDQLCHPVKAIPKKSAGRIKGSG